MKKIKIECYFNLDNTNNTRTLSRLKFSLSVIDSATGEIVLIHKSNNADIGTILKQLLSRWDNSNNRLTLTVSQWGVLLDKIKRII